MPINSRQKGCRGERLFRDFLKERGIDARRGQQFSGGVEAPDVVADHPGWHCEVKFVENLNVGKALEQATKDAGDWKLPYVAHKRKGGPWRVYMDAEAFVGVLNFLRAYKASWKRNPETGHITFEPNLI